MGDGINPRQLASGDIYDAILNDGTFTEALVVGGNDDNGNGAALILGSDSNDSNFPVIIAFSSQGDIATPDTSGNGDGLFSIIARGFDGTNFQNAAFIRVKVADDPSAGHVPAKLEFLAENGAGVSSLMTMHGPEKAVIQAAPATSPSALLSSGQISFYLDEVGNKLMVAVQYSDGTTKTGEVALT